MKVCGECEDHPDACGWPDEGCLICEEVQEDRARERVWRERYERDLAKWRQREADIKAGRRERGLPVIEDPWYYAGPGNDEPPF